MTKTKFDETYIFKISMKIWFFYVCFSIKIPFFRVSFTIERVAPYYSSLPRTVWNNHEMSFLNPKRQSIIQLSSLCRGNATLNEKKKIYIKIFFLYTHNHVIKWFIYYRTKTSILFLFLVKRKFSVVLET